ncbi:MAG: YbbR-like domain-containing protein [Desulfovibrionaceae bacterium]
MRGSNWQYMLLSLLLAIVAWFMVSGREKVEVWREAPVQFTGMPSGIVIRSGLRNKIDIRIRGPKGLIHSLDQKVPAYSLDLSSLKAGPNVIALSPDEIPLAKTFEVVEISPPRLTLDVDRVVTRTLAVHPFWDGRLPDDFELAEASSDPPEVTLRGPESLVGSLDAVATRALVFNATGVTDGQVVEQIVDLNLPPEVEVDPGIVKARLTFALKTVQMWVTLKLGVSAPWHKSLRFTPRRVRALVDVPLPLSRVKDIKNQFSADLVVRAGLAAGTHELPYRVVLPEGCALVRAEPDVAQVTVE